MRLLKLAVVAVAALAFGDAYAFHDGGVAYCDGCHVMHNASNGKSVTTRGGQPARSDKTNPFLLQGSDQSSTCLICHSGIQSSNGRVSQYHVADFTTAKPLAPTNFTPGGDFGWLSRDYAWTTPRAGSSTGTKHGHSVIAADFGLTTVDNNRAPGGAYMTGTGISAFACSSCHDPHGRYRLQGDVNNPVIRGPMSNDTAINPIVASGSYPIDAATAAAMSVDEAVGVYRILAGKGYRPFSNPGFPFQNDPPIAVAPKTYNQAENAAEVRVAYGKGMSEWCGNCHGYIHLDNYATGANGLVHPAGNGAVLRQLQTDIYNKYRGSGDLTGSSMYTSLVPFESQNANLLTLGAAANNTDVVGTTATNPIFTAVANQTTVMCLSCHRAHASAWDNMVRWNPVSEFLAFRGYPGTDSPDAEASAGNYAQGRTMAEHKAGYYNRNIAKGQIAPFQRSLCNKCHAKD